jgi:hypothetical protein
LAVLLAAFFLFSFAGCDAVKGLIGEDDGSSSGGGGSSGGVPVVFQEIKGDEGGTTTLVTLVFDKDIPGLSEGDVTITSAGDTGAVAGVLSPTKAAGAYTLAVSGVKETGPVTISVGKSGYTFTPATQTAVVNFDEASNKVTFVGAIANVTANTQTTTALTLSFYPGISLQPGDITLWPGSTGAVMGNLALSGDGAYMLAVPGVAAEGEVCVTVVKDGYAVRPATVRVPVHYPGPATGGGGGGGGGEIGLTWTTVDNAGSDHLYGIAYGGGTFVAVGAEGKTAYSADGATWTPGADIQYASMASGIAYGNGTFVAVGGGGVLAYSTDGGKTWTDATNGLLTENLRGIAYGGGKFVAGGQKGENNNAVAYSTDGKQPWTAANTAALENPFIMSIAYNGSMFMAVDYSGKVAYSLDGAYWAAVDNASSSALYGIAYGGGTFVAVGEGGKAAYSTNGTTWTAAQTGLTSAITGIAYGGGKFVAVGEGGKAAYSTNGVTWTAVETTFTSTLSGIAYGGGRFVAVGDYGKAAYSNKQE